MAINVGMGKADANRKGADGIARRVARRSDILAAACFALTVMVGLDAGSVVAAPRLPVCPVVNGTERDYDIVRNGSVIGHHTLHFTTRGDDLTVTISVEASVRILGVRVYRYEHHATEYWLAGRMIRVVTRTDDDGTIRQVDASLDPLSNAWRGTAGPNVISGPLFASSLWNSGTVRQTRLLDHETGKVTPVRITPQGEEEVQLGAVRVQASRFDMVGDTSGTVWYDRKGCWVSAVFKSPVDGSKVELRSLSAG